MVVTVKNCGLPRQLQGCRIRETHSGEILMIIVGTTDHYRNGVSHCGATTGVISKLTHAAPGSLSPGSLYRGGPGHKCAVYGKAISSFVRCRNQFNSTAGLFIFTMRFCHLLQRLFLCITVFCIIFIFCFAAELTSAISTDHRHYFGNFNSPSDEHGVVSNRPAHPRS